MLPCSVGTVIENIGACLRKKARGGGGAESEKLDGYFAAYVFEIRAALQNLRGGPGMGT